VAGPPLPLGWVQLHDAASSQPYYHHSGTGVTQWERPSLAPPPPAAPLLAAAAAPARARPADVATWSADEVCAWLGELDLAHLQDAFRTGRIKGSLLAALCADERRLHKMGVTAEGDVMILQMEVAKLDPTGGTTASATPTKTTTTTAAAPPADKAAHKAAAPVATPTTPVLADRTPPPPPPPRPHPHANGATLTLPGPRIPRRQRR
jgi:hypothetical protein